MLTCYQSRAGLRALWVPFPGRHMQELTPVMSALLPRAPDMGEHAHEDRTYTTLRSHRVRCSWITGLDVVMVSYCRLRPSPQGEGARAGLVVGDYRNFRQVTGPRAPVYRFETGELCSGGQSIVVNLEPRSVVKIRVNYAQEI